MDTILRFVDGIKYDFYYVVDVRGKLAFSLMCEHLNNQNTIDFFKKLVRIYSYAIAIIKQANG